MKGEAPAAGATSPGLEVASEESLAVGAVEALFQMLAMDEMSHDAEDEPPPAPLQKRTKFRPAPQDSSPSRSTMHC